ncbi:MAG: hypothetical protein IJE09_07125 [Oscillospiraceae bacterium]|nr:hypothetical protein [Oscillospiraceae bacterium]
MHNIKRILACVLTVCLTLAILAGLTQLTEKKEGYAKHAEFFDQEENYDVMFIGASPAMNGIYPMEMWKDYGIVSYNMAEAAHPLPASHWVMRLALEEKQPELVVIDCFRLNLEPKTTANFSLMHTSLDSFPMSRTKVEAIFDLLDDPYKYEAEEGESRGAINMLWNFSVFHSRWDSLTENDFRPQKSYGRGAITNTGIFYDEMEKISPEDKLAVEATGLEYLRRMIEHCQSRGIEVLLISMPFAANEEEQRLANFAGDIAEEYGLNYVNFLQMDLINYHTDMADNNCHMNPSGARKLTNWLGEYIQQNYDIPDRREDSRFAFWHEDYEKYNLAKNADLQARSELYNILMLLYGDGLDAVLHVKDKSLYNDSLVLELLGALNVDTESLNKNSDVIIIRNGGEQSAVLDNVLFDGAEHDSPVGKILPIRAENGAQIRLDEDLYFPIMEDRDCSIAIARNGVPVDYAGFDYVYDEAAGMIQQINIVR